MTPQFRPSPTNMTLGSVHLMLSTEPAVVVLEMWSTFRAAGSLISCKRYKCLPDRHGTVYDKRVASTRDKASRDETGARLCIIEASTIVESGIGPNRCCGSISFIDIGFASPSNVDSSPLGE
ncbi:uncharacterized protein UHOD_11033 [Ustilago sp. UG-2017b]|nr:uncharacterized protein UHOD_11033 [Ustilago sp. UG-2017b]